MRKTIVVILLAVVAMTAAFANTSNKDGFALKADAISLFGSYDACYRMGDFEFSIGYLTYGPVYSLVCNIAGIVNGEYSPESLLLFVDPLGAYAGVEYKFLATAQHEVGAYIEGGWCRLIGYAICAGAEYDFCFNANHAVYAKVGASFIPFFPGFEFSSAIGYRYTF